ncbi:MAG: hypothetical protein CMH53_04725 [Myxococcales bacterium]|nr:hypothetical protein [Myxococcales bacterium]
MLRMTAAITLLLATIAAPSSYATLPQRAMRFHHKNFVKHDQAVENLTLRGSTSAGGSAFVRVSIANAGFQRGKLTLTVVIKSRGKSIYAKKSFAKGRYKIFSDRFGFRAGANRLEATHDTFTFNFALKGAKGSVILDAKGPSVTAKDRDSTGFISRHLICPWGRLKVALVNNKGAQVNDNFETFGIYESSTLKAHRSYDKMVQVHQLAGHKMRIVDYLVGPKERNKRPLGFVVIRDGSRRFAGRVDKHTMSKLRVDRKNNYRVPWNIFVQAKRGGKSASMTLSAVRQVKRTNELAKMSYLTRKVVSMWMHPVSYKLQAVCSHQIEGPGNARKATMPCRYTYNQTR